DENQPGDFSPSWSLIALVTTCSSSPSSKKMPWQLSQRSARTTSCVYSVMLPEQRGQLSRLIPSASTAAAPSAGVAAGGRAAWAASSARDFSASCPCSDLIEDCASPS